MANSTRLTIIWLACMAAATLAPFNFVRPPAEIGEFTTFSHGSRQQEPVHLVLNMLLFVPLGILIARGRYRSFNLVSSLIIVGIAGFLISFAIECLQRLLPSREPSLVDVMANTAGALIGVVTSRAALGVETLRTCRREP